MSRDPVTLLRAVWNIYFHVNRLCSSYGVGLEQRITSSHFDSGVTWQYILTFSHLCRGGFRGQGGGGARGPRGPRPPLSSGSGIFWDNFLEWYMSLYEPTDSRRRNTHKNIAFAKLLPAFPENWGSQISKFSRGTSLAYECLHICFKPPTSERAS